jgi:hypothetical protein
MPRLNVSRNSFTPDLNRNAWCFNGGLFASVPIQAHFEWKFGEQSMGD